MLFGEKNNESQKPIRHQKSFEIKEKIADMNSDWVEYYCVKCEMVSVANFKKTFFTFISCGQICKDKR